EACLLFLTSLNSGKVTSKKIEQTRLWLNALVDLPFREAYKIAAAFIENVVQRHENTKDNFHFLRVVFNSTIINTNIIEALSARSSAYSSKGYTTEVNFPNANNELFKPGDREEAIKYIRNWIEMEANEYIKICDSF